VLQQHASPYEEQEAGYAITMFLCAACHSKDCVYHYLHLHWRDDTADLKLFEHSLACTWGSMQQECTRHSSPNRPDGLPSKVRGAVAACSTSILCTCRCIECQPNWWHAGMLLT
jgi:hypothetical protein